MFGESVPCALFIYCSTQKVQADMQVMKPVTEFDLVCIESLKEEVCVWDY
jgi:hypothetical protein